MARLSPADAARLKSRYFDGALEKELLAEFPGFTVGALRRQLMHVQAHRPPTGTLHELRPLHPALLQARTLFPNKVRDVNHVAVLKTGRDQRKLGARVEKGAWRGFPIFSLTLEERATCPDYCPVWRGCMGNGMQWAVRLRHGILLEEAIDLELQLLQHLNPDGFVVRLHILGDFYAPQYVERWREWLDKYPALHVFGYSAWHPKKSRIGRAVAVLANARWDRFAVRFSTDAPGRQRAMVLRALPDGTERERGIVVCPAEINKTAGCNTCGLCWSPAARDLTIAFIAHGGTERRGRPARKARAGEYATAIAEQGSQRRAAAALGISLGKLQRGLRLDTAWGQP